MKLAIEAPTAEVFVPLLDPAPYKGAKGGRASGKSHFFAELAVEEMVADPSLRFVCIREVQRSLKFSAKALVEAKIRSLGVERLFEVLTTEIRRKGGTGVMIFEGMQDHTADSLKSLEGFGRAWVEEAQSLSQRSLDLLIPTIRAEGSELWFSWNPDQPTDPIDKFLVQATPPGAVVVHANYLDNPFCPEKSKEQARSWDPETYDHVWLGGYNVKSDAIVLSGKWKADEFVPGDDWDGPYFGADWGFSQDPTCLVRLWRHDGRLFIEHEVAGIQWDNDEIDRRFRSVPGADAHTIRADNARPETINEQRNRGLNVVPCDKWKGSVEDGVQHLRSYTEIVIHPRCTGAIEEARLWRYKQNKAGDVLPQLVDAHNHRWDAIRYALGPWVMKQRPVSGWFPGMDS